MRPEPFPPDLGDLEARLAARPGPEPPGDLRDRVLAAATAELRRPAAPRRPRVPWNILGPVAAAVVLAVNFGMNVAHEVRLREWAALANAGPPPEVADTPEGNNGFQRFAAGAVASVKPAPDVGAPGRYLFSNEEGGRRWDLP